MLRDAVADITAFAEFPRRTGARSGRPTPLERLNREVKRRTDIVGTFPNPARAAPPGGPACSSKPHNEWQVSDRRYLSEEAAQRQYRSDQETHKRGERTGWSTHSTAL
ncbi:MAG: transposase [Actinomycetota bacterium]|nr:transposase [Actinomycetota bacterium]